MADEQPTTADIYRAAFLRATPNAADITATVNYALIHPSPLACYSRGAWLRAELARYTYKPGFTFAIVPSDLTDMYGAEWALRLTVDVEDTYHPGRRTQVCSQHVLWNAEHMDEHSFARQLAHLIQDFEVHEAREWLKRDGVIWDNPHK